MESFLPKLRSSLRKWVIYVALRWTRVTPTKTRVTPTKTRRGGSSEARGTWRKNQPKSWTEAHAREDRYLMLFSVHAAFIIPLFWLREAARGK